MSSTSLACRTVVPAPPDQVWATLAAFDQISRWAPNVDHSAYTTVATSGTGAARRVQAGRTALVETVVEWRPTTSLAYRLDGLPPLARSVVNRWDLEPAPGGGTTATLTSVIDPLAGPRGRVATKVLGAVLTRASKSMLGGLAAHDHGAVDVEGHIDQTDRDPADRHPADRHPADIDPADVDPADVDPADVDPADVDPADVEGQGRPS